MKLDYDQETCVWIIAKPTVGDKRFHVEKFKHFFFIIKAISVEERIQKNKDISYT